MSYEQQIDKVIDFIGKHIDEELELDELCRIACFSKYHFHRLFTVYTGLPLMNYIKWLRIKRAAHQLIMHKRKTIINIAFDAGFESHESFSRAFKQICGQSPSKFRHNANWASFENPPKLLNIKGEKNMTIAIKELPTKRVAVIEHRGDPMKLSCTLDKLITWANKQSINLKPKSKEAFGFGYHDPKEVEAKDFRFDLALSVPKDFKLNDEVIERIIPAGRYAVVMHNGSLDNVGDTIYNLYKNWLPQSGEKLGDLPCIFCYHNFAHEVAEPELLTEILVLLK